MTLINKLSLFTFATIKFTKAPEDSCVVWIFTRSSRCFLWRSVLNISAAWPGIAAGTWRTKSCAKQSPSYFKSGCQGRLLDECFFDMLPWSRLRVFPYYNTNIASCPRITSPEVFIRVVLVSGMRAKLRNDKTPGDLNWAIKSFHVPISMSYQSSELFMLMYYRVVTCLPEHLYPNPMRPICASLVCVWEFHRKS